MCIVDTWLIIFDKSDLGFSYDFMKMIGLRIYNNYKFVSFNEKCLDKLQKIEVDFNRLFIAIWDTNKVIKCVSNLSNKIIENIPIYSASTTDLTQFNIQKIKLITLDGLYIDICNETLFGKVDELALPIETIACYDYDNKSAVCLNHSTKIFQISKAKGGTYLPSYGIEKNTQWRLKREDSLEFSNLALREALIDKKRIFIDENRYIIIKENNVELYGSYNAFRVYLRIEFLLALAGIIVVDNELELNSGKATAILLNSIL